MALTEAERLEAYKVCQERGHTSSGITLTSNPPWSVCKFCGTRYRTETRLIESNVPSGGDLPVTEDGGQ